MKIRKTKLGIITILINIVISILAIIVPFLFNIDQDQNELILSTLFFTPLSCLSIATDFRLYRELRFLLLSSNIVLVFALIISACSSSQLCQHLSLFLGTVSTMIMLNGTVVLLPGRDKHDKNELDVNEWKKYK